jgi:hypothetical protein
MNLSKSQFLRGLQCVKSLWLYKHKRDIAVTSPDASSQNVFDTGTRVGLLAQELFPNGETIPFEGTSFSEKIERTKSCIDEGVETIYEATFEFEGILVMVDILHKGANGWEIYEVKSSTEVKEVYLQDASVQYYVLIGSGLSISSVNIVYINNKYVRGNELEIDKLFSIANVTEKIMVLQDNIPNYLSDFEKVVDNQDEPEIEIGMHCFKPYECDCMNYCWKDVPEYSIFDLANIRKKKAFGFYKEGVVTFDDITDLSLFSKEQQSQIQSELENRIIINKEAIQEFISGLTYPLYHLDFETFQQAIPEFEGVNPFQQIPFQYSLHIEHTEGAEPNHREFLGVEGTDPREEFIKHLIDDIPADACVLVYNENFEKTRLKELAKDFPLYEAKLMMIHDNVVDLAEPFRKKHYYNYTLKGKYSIKLIMPLMVPEMADAYKKLALVQNGGDAMNTFPALIHMEPQQREAYREALLKYCELDTLSMVKILEKLREHVK